MAAAAWTATVLGASLVLTGAVGASWVARAKVTRESASTRATGAEASPDGKALAALGRAIFFDADLSEPRGTSCASCHDPAHAFSGDNGSTMGVALGSRPGHHSRRNTPSLLYLRYVRRFHLRWDEDVSQPEASGGFFWDGRADSIAKLVRQPLLDPDEMNGGDATLVAAKIEHAAYAEDFRRAFGPAFDDPSAVLDEIGRAVEAFLLGDDMAPFSSKFDDVLRGRATFTPLEARGLALFRDHAKGGCDGCHRVHDNLPDPTRSLFTDFGYDSVGVPRNRLLPENRDPARFDLGVCARPAPAFHSDDERFCGRFRTPSLRNVAVRTHYMHNGVFADLRDVVAFYATGRVDPARWYAGATQPDDLPERYREYVNVHDAPYNRRPGQAPALDDGEIDAIVAFLHTLTDAQFLH